MIKTKLPNTHTLKHSSGSSPQLWHAILTSSSQSSQKLATDLELLWASVVCAASLGASSCNIALYAHDSCLQIVLVRNTWIWSSTGVSAMGQKNKMWDDKCTTVHTAKHVSSHIGLSVQCIPLVSMWNESPKNFKLHTKDWWWEHVEFCLTLPHPFLSNLHYYPAAADLPVFFFLFNSLLATVSIRYWRASVTSTSMTLCTETSRWVITGVCFYLASFLWMKMKDTCIGPKQA